MVCALLCTVASIGQENPPQAPLRRRGRHPLPRRRRAAPQQPDPAATPPPGGAAPRRVEDDEFIPTEELAPDAAVTFPVDI